MDFFADNDKMPLLMIDCGMLDCEKDFSCGPNVREMFIIHYIIKGKGCYEVNGERYYPCEGDAFVIFPDDLVRYYTDSENPWSFCWISFAGCEAQGYVSRAGIDKKQLVTDMHNSRIHKVIHSCIEYTRENGVMSDLRTSAYILECLSELERTIRKKGDTKKELRYADNAILFMEYHYSEGIGVSDVAKHLGLERSYFYRLFKKATGISPERYLINCRIEKAKRLIEMGFDFKGIAELVGISDVYYFSKLFKRLSGITPSEYRLQINKEKKG